MTSVPVPDKIMYVSVWLWSAMHGAVPSSESLLGPRWMTPTSEIVRPYIDYFELLIHSWRSVLQHFLDLFVLCMVATLGFGCDCAKQTVGDTAKRKLGLLVQVF